LRARTERLKQAGRLQDPQDAAMARARRRYAADDYVHDHLEAIDRDRYRHDHRPAISRR
jgi:hypothetical protein